MAQEAAQMTSNLIYVDRLREFARENGGDVFVVGRDEFTQLSRRRGFYLVPGGARMGLHYRRRHVTTQAPILDRAIHLIPNLVHELWHVFAAPAPPTSMCDEGNYWSIAWELAMMQHVRCPLVRWQRRWGKSTGDDVTFKNWPAPILGRLSDVSPTRFLSWAYDMIETGKTRGYRTDRVEVGCVTADGRPKTHPRRVI